MAEVKWVKLTTDMFDNRKIRHLRRLPEGNNIVLIWVMLLTMAGRCNSGGMIFLTENIPYTPKMLADELDFEENTVLLALKALEQLDMIVTDNGVFAIAGWEEYQNIEGMEKIREQNRERKRLQRERQKQALLEESRDSHVTVTGCHAVDIDKEKDKEITTTTINNTLSYIQSDEFKLYQRVCQSFKDCGILFHPDMVEDFIAYNNSRDWLGIGGESVLDNLDRYVSRWFEGEKSRKGTKDGRQV
jgi:predicted phage replisome organizer